MCPSRRGPRGAGHTTLPYDDRARADVGGTAYVAGMSATDTAELRRRFRTLHQTGIFVMPNPWDVGSARLLEVVGFPALATTSSGLGAALGRDDQTVGRDNGRAS